MTVSNTTIRQRRKAALVHGEPKHRGLFFGTATALSLNRQDQPPTSFGLQRRQGKGAPPSDAPFPPPTDFEQSGARRPGAG